MKPKTEAWKEYWSEWNDATVVEQAIFMTGIKAGRKEVVDFIGKEPFEHNYSQYGHEVNDCFACRYEAKLKDWGLE